MRDKRSDNPYHLSSLKNGLRLALSSQPQARSTAIGLWVRAGGRYEKESNAGISHFVEHLLFKGTRKRSCEALKQRIEGVGGALNGFTAEEVTCFMAKVPRQHANQALEVLTDMLQASRFDPRDIEKEREVILEEIRMVDDSPGQMIHDLFSQLLWPGHPLGMLLSGTRETVKALTRKQLVDYWRRMYQPRNMVVAVCGAFDVLNMRRTIEALWGRAAAGPASRFMRAPRLARTRQVRIWNKKTEQTHLCVGSLAVARMHPQRFALELLHVLMGGNMSSRLFREVREKRGLAYEIGTSIKRLQDAGAFVVSAGCDTGKATQTVKTIFTELSRVRRFLVSKAELRRAKDYYAGQLMMGLEDTMDHLLWMGEQAITVNHVARPEALVDHLEKVTPSDIRQVARSLFLTDRMRVAVIGPLSQPESASLIKECNLS